MRDSYLKKSLVLVVSTILFGAVFISFASGNINNINETINYIPKTSTENIQISNNYINSKKETWPPQHYEVEFLPRITVVHVNEGDTDTEYDFLSSIPMMVFHHNSKVFQGLVISDQITDDATSNILEDWELYTADWGGVQHINFVGDVTLNVKNTFLGQFDVNWEETTNITGTSISIANQIALHDWKYSDYVVIAPYISSLSSESDIESISNAAALASLYNAPLLFSEPDTISQETLDAIDELDASYAVLVEIGDSINSAVNDQLELAGISIIHDLTTENMVVSLFRTLTGSSTLCSITINWQNLPAALAGARYGGYILFLPDNIANKAKDTSDILKNLKMSPYKLTSHKALPNDYKYGEEALASDFYNWLQGIGGSDTDKLETVITFNTQPYYDSADGFDVTFDRAISGDPSDLTNPGAVTGRMPLEFIGNIALTNRNNMYRATIFANPRPMHITLAMNAYEVWHDVDDSGYYGPDSWGQNHIVNEIFGWPYRGWVAANDNFPWQDIQDNTPGISPILPPGPGDGPDNDPGQFASFNEFYETHFHSGEDPGTGSHPSQPGVSNIGFVNDINAGSAFLYFSCHGGGTSIAVRNTDNGVAQDASDNVPWGDDYWPSTDGRVYDGSAGGSYSQYDLDNDLNNVHGAMTAYNACDMANGKMNEVLLEHGGSASFGSYTSVSFDGSGWWWNLFVHLITHEGYTIGEAATYATARVADLYTPGSSSSSNEDSSLQYVVYGDPNIKFVQSTWTSPEPLPINVDYGGHKPDKPPRSFIVTVDPTTIPILTESTINVNVIDDSTYLPVIANVTISGWGVLEIQETDLNGDSSLILTPLYGEDLCLKVEKEDYDDYETILTVTGGNPTSGEILASIPSLGVTNILAPTIEGLIEASSSTTDDFTLSVAGCGVEESIPAISGIANLYVTPLATGYISAAILEPGYNIYTVNIPVSTLHLDVSYTPSSLTVGYELLLEVSVECIESNNAIEGATVEIIGCGLDETLITNEFGIASTLVTPDVDGTVTINVSRNGFEPATTTISVQTAQMTIETVDKVYVDEQVPVTFWVNDSTTGYPVEGALVSLTGSGVSTSGLTESGVVTLIIQPTTTGIITVIVTKQGYDPAQTTIDVTAGPVGTIQGVVTDSSNDQELSNVKVELYHPSVNPYENEPAFYDETDESGLYIIQDIPTGEYNIFIVEYGYDTYLDTINILEDQTITHNIGLTPAQQYTINGDILDANTHDLIPSAVAVFRNDTDEEIITIQVPTGEYSLQLYPYTYRFLITADNHLPYQEILTLTDDLEYNFELTPAIFSDNIESGENGWSHNADSGPDLWHISTRDSYSPGHSWYCGYETIGEYDDSMDNSLISPVIDLTNMENAVLSFWHRYEFESPNFVWDGSDVEISVNSGPWEQIIPVDGYDGDVYAGSNAAFPRDVLVYAHSSDGWSEEIFILDEYVGSTVEIRFRFGSDATVHDYEGWFVDDITIYGELSGPLCDLTVSEISFTEENPTKGQLIKIDALIANNGETDAMNVNVQFVDIDAEDRETIIGTDVIPIIEAGLSENASIIWEAVVGYHNIKVVVDPDDFIDEMNENNNVLTKEIIVEEYLCGDANGDGFVDIDDGVYLVNYIFSGGPTPIPVECVGDANGDSSVDIDDVVYIIAYIFSGGPEPSGCCS